MLLSLKYENHMVKTATAKRLVEEKNISVREAERQLDADAYPTECEQWVLFGLQHDFLLHRMFVHAMATGQQEHDHAIHHGRWEPSPVWDLGMEPSMVELIYANSTREEIAKIYQDVYQLQWLPGKMPCNVETEEQLCQEILDSVKECLWHKWDPTLQEELRCPTSTLRHDPQADYSTQTHANYGWLKDMTWGSCQEALAVVRDAHSQVLVAVALLEDKIERLRCSVSCGHWQSGSHRHSGSCWHRLRTGSHLTKTPQTASHQGGPPGGDASPPAPCTWGGR